MNKIIQKVKKGGKTDLQYDVGGDKKLSNCEEDIKNQDLSTQKVVGMIASSFAFNVKMRRCNMSLRRRPSAEEEDFTFRVTVRPQLCQIHANEQIKAQGYKQNKI